MSSIRLKLIRTVKNVFTGTILEQKQKVFLREATGLVREISPFGAFVIGVIAISMPLSTFFLFNTLPSIFPQTNVIVIMSIVIVPVFFWAMMYLLLNLAMPRTGGDYVWTSRTVSPVVGFTENFFLLFVQVTFLGTIAAVTMLSFVAFMPQCQLVVSSIGTNPYERKCSSECLLLMFVTILLVLREVEAGVQP